MSKRNVRGFRSLEPQLLYRMLYVMSKMLLWCSPLHPTLANGCRATPCSGSITSVFVFVPPELKLDSTASSSGDGCGGAPPAGNHAFFAYCSHRLAADTCSVASAVLQMWPFRFPSSQVSSVSLEW